MSKQLLSVIAAVAVALGLLNLARHYLSPEPSPSEGSGSALAPTPGEPVTPESRTPEPQSEPPIAASDPVYDFNHEVAQTQRHLTEFVKIARVGEEQIRVQFSTAPRSRPPRGIDDGKSGGFFEPLVQAIEAGDAAAARMLYGSLKNCERAPTTEVALRAAEARTRDAFAKTGGRVASETVTLDAVLGNVRAAYERCQGVTPDMTVKALDYLRESEEPDNRLLYAQAILTEKPDEAREILEAAWNEQGRVPALDMLAQTSLPHKIASLAVLTTLFDGRHEEPAAVRIIAEAREELTAIENSTSPSTFSAATEEAARLLKSPICCKL